MRFIRPEYIYRSSQIFRRLSYFLGITRSSESAMLPWGLPIKFGPKESRGRAILTLDLSDLRSLELISRIVRAGDTWVDIGANIGLMSSLMAKRAGLSGTVFSFEPHPRTRNFLEDNSEILSSGKSNSATVTVIPFAVSSNEGHGILHEAEGFPENSGLATLETKSEFYEKSESSIKVKKVRFDDWADFLSRIRIVKIDTEGHEDQVLSGIKNSLLSKKIDFLILEEMHPLPSFATNFLRDLGYQTFLIEKTLRGPLLIDTAYLPHLLVGEATNIIAVSPTQAVEDLTGVGWTCLKY